MKKLGFILCLCWFMGMSVMADDPSLLRVDGREVRLSEFVWYFHRAGGKDADAYFQRFLEYQLKVAEAKAMGLDTLSDFHRQHAFLQSRVLKNHFMNHQLADSLYREMTVAMSDRRSEKEWLKVDVFTFRLSQHAAVSEEDTAVRVMDEWAQRLKKSGMPTAGDLSWALGHGVKQDRTVREWTPSTRLLKELIHTQAALELGAWSKPFRSPLGIHILRVTERKTDAGKEWVPQLERYLENQGTSTPSVNRDTYEAWKDGTYELPAEVRYALTEAHDGLLAIYWDQYHQQVSETEAINPAVLEQYFRSHKKDYRWEYPHYKGAVIHCLNKKAASKIKKRLKKLPMSCWKEALQRMQQENAAYSGELDCGLFQIGKNPYVDRLAFKCGTYQPKENYPYTFLLGKKLKKGPEVYTDVLSEVTADYRKQHEKDRISRLFARFHVEINEDVLKTVNSCGNK